MDPQVLREEQADAAASIRLERAEPLRVPFSGRRGGDGPLTLGQGSTFEWVTNPAFYTRMIEWPLTIPPGTTLDDITAAMAVLMARHESLRTTFPAVEPPVQRVAWAGELVIDVYEAGVEATDSRGAHRAADPAAAVPRVRPDRRTCRCGWRSRRGKGSPGQRSSCTRTWPWTSPAWR